jgi:hypothetical protein
MPSLANEASVPEKVHRRSLDAKQRKTRICIDDKVYSPFTFTIPAASVAATDYDAWVADRDYWIERITVSVGRHDAGSHPSDGAVAGQALRMNARRITADGSGDAGIMASDTRVQVAVGKHTDEVTNGTDPEFGQGDFNITTLERGEQVYVRITQAPSSSGTVVITLMLVPMRVVV